jgi:signal transduction histidine kinase/tetratricopeptide (TPR) repeat protein
MLDNFKIAVKRQKKLIIIFLLTIFLPSIALSIFGVRVIRNEKFRLVQQLEDEHRRAAAFLKNQVDSRFEDVELTLQNLAQNPFFVQKNYAYIEESLNNQLKDDQLIELVFLAYKDEEPLFPLFLPVSPRRVPTAISSQNSAQRDSLEKAQRLEFSQKDFAGAAVLYEQIFSRYESRDIQARMLNNMARCYTKLENFDKAIQHYSRICEEYPQCTTSSLLPLGLIAKIQIVRCYRSQGAHTQFMTSAIELYKNLLQKQWYLDANQFNTYTSMIEKDISDYLSIDERDLEKDSYSQKFEELKELHHKMNEQWEMVNNIKSSILPELQRRFSLQNTLASSPFRHTRTIDQKDYLVLASAVPQDEKEEFLGLLGIKINDDYLLRHEVNRILDDFPFSRDVSLSISTLSGRILSEYGSPSCNNPTVTAYFDESFPPWRVDFFSAAEGNSGVIDLRKSFYFWTILTILVLLTFGAGLVVRTVAHEMEVLRLKSDFVSSVSHEFKTPITAIKTSIERLQQGKVKTPDKRKEYYSIISKDADKLSSLVRNILDYSKVDAGRKQYFFENTDIARLVEEEIGSFKRDKIFAGIKIEIQISPDIPSIDIDKEAFSLAFNNLLENAVKFSPVQKKVYVEVRQDAENVRVNVKDEGVGIDSNEMDKIFDKFYQGKNTARQSLKGTGLGLTLVKHVMDAHGGKVTVESKIGEGCTFSLIFPKEQRGRKI